MKYIIGAILAFNFGWVLAEFLFEHILLKRR